MCSRLEVEALDWFLSSPPLVLNESVIDLYRDTDAVHISGRKPQSSLLSSNPAHFTLVIKVMIQSEVLLISHLQGYQSSTTFASLQGSV